eukprot:UN06967
MVNGWGILNLETNSTYDDWTQMYAAGMAEGYLTGNRIYDHAANVMDILFGDKSQFLGEVPSAVIDFMSEQETWVENNISKDNTDTMYQVGSIFQQYQGLKAGYSYSGAKPLTDFHFQVLNGLGDLFQIIPAVVPNTRIDWLKKTQEEAELLYAKRTHCSALIKVTGNLTDLIYGHSSLFEFSHTNRIYKYYNFRLQAPTTATTLQSFSSYPGYLESLDDFYMMDSGLGMTQTSNDVMDQKLLDKIKPQSLLAWQRVRLANVMAKTGKQWAHYFDTHPSGTYVNQYMIVDFKLFEPGRPLNENLLWVIEEIPGLILSEDVTQQLERGYWPSYNIPYFKQIWSMSGYEAMYNKTDNTYWTYDLAPRA